MKRVALLGFSTAGKSSILQHIKEKEIKDIVLKDTDSMISEQYGGHIYNILFVLVEGTNRDPALRYIEKAENEALGYLLTVKEPLVVAIGPGVPAFPIRPNWPIFYKTSFNIYIEQTPEEVYEGLIKRRKRHVWCGLKKNPLFGCWDEGVTTCRKGNRWVLVSKKEAIRNIKKHMGGLIPAYMEVADYTIKKRELFSKGGIDRLVANILKELNLG